jgi:putative transposase
MDKFKNKYRIPSARLQNWNYGSPGSYFITICTKDRQHYFGEIKDGKMILNELGLIANAEWEKTKLIRPDMNLELGEYVVMPNHFHGIIIIGGNNNGDYNRTNDMNLSGIGYRTGIDIHNTTTKNKFGPQSKNLGSIIRGFKSSVTTFARKNNIAFDWQERFHDHVIRDPGEYSRISNYIKANPANW